MSKFEKSMEKIFDVTPFQGNPNIDQDKQVTLVPEPRSYERAEPDLKGDLTDAYEQSKDNLQELIDNGKEAMEELLQIAKEGQHPRAYEVYGTLLKNMVDANKELLSIQKQMRDMDNNRQKAGDTKIDKAIFVGTAADLNKLLKDE
jgi:Terminase DNA packaging enzyme